jgi:catecholate siderophore receptor
MPDYGVPALNGHPAPVGRDTFYGYTDDRTVQDVQTCPRASNIASTTT